MIDRTPEEGTVNDEGIISVRKVPGIIETWKSQRIKITNSTLKGYSVMYLFPHRFYSPFVPYPVWEVLFLYVGCSCFLKQLIYSYLLISYKVYDRAQKRRHNNGPEIVVTLNRKTQKAVQQKFCHCWTQ